MRRFLFCSVPLATRPGRRLTCRVSTWANTDAVRYEDKIGGRKSCTGTTNASSNLSPHHKNHGSRIGEVSKKVRLDASERKGELRELEERAPRMLEDRFGRFHNYLRISLTERCNLRCTYCMPEEGVQLTPEQRLLDAEEIQRITSLFVEEGVNRIRFTGGEPLLRKDLADIVKATSELRPKGLREIAMTTNGITLGRKVADLKDAGLDSVNVSLDTLDPFKFEILTRRRGMDKVLESVQKSLDFGIKTKVNAVIIRGVNDDDVHGFAALAQKQPLEVRFIEYMPFDGNRWDHSKLVPYMELVDRIREKYPNFTRVKHEDAPNAVSRLWHVEGWEGRIGFISSMTDHFCGTCNRIRITADGNLKSCLFGNEEVSLRDAMRNGATNQDLKQLIHQTLQLKKARHAGMFDIAKDTMRPMTTIGG
mmetsp:Transcript_14797/g.20733  ORF Transcript_14797/g.20733 Transcript_14797/m.20733 type:complete len:422 (+) Transcript_14797:169-1434(+)|eukprot:CAMPEP_0184485998 /NCGR_PEP_ID=MMETSP0113_2-20130426/7555_1 /TAXON_ID=91329 /ORGANISM="Norrisiella sphaerica, Strain BC52" /LENGTH=421 /DNA_ID=CAMNT_0026867693 /DNA_START=129 /DNA_END=1394 /DNA_ORIENTATION=-